MNEVNEASPAQAKPSDLERLVRRLSDDELAQLKADAARYRWLRGDSGTASVRWPRWSIQHWAMGTWNPVQGEAMDSAVDDAMDWDNDT